MPYTPNIINRCKDIFGRIDIFNDQEHLRTFFYGDLDVHKTSLPDNAKNSKQRMELCVNFLLKLPSSEEGKPAIVSFIINLMSHYSEEESGIRSQLTDLLNEFSKEAVNSIQRVSKDKQRLDRQEIEDFQQARQILLNTDGSHEIAEWFKSSDSITEKIFKITLAVLNGARYSSVINAAESLVKLISKNVNEPSSAMETVPFSRGRSSRLEFSEIKDVQNAFGEKVTTIQYKNPSYPYNVLEYVWKEYDDSSFREPFITWLTSMAVDRQVDIRNRIALTVGVLAQLDFPDVRDMVLCRWAQKNDRLYRAAIGKALGVASENEAIGNEVILTLQSWGKSKEESLVWAANRAYSNVGILYPQKAFEQWKKTLSSTDRLVDYKITSGLHLSVVNPLHMSIIDSILLLLLTAPDTEKYLSVYQVTLQQFLTWTDSESTRSKANLGLSLFIVCMNTFVQELENTNSSKKETLIEIPAMVKLASVYNTYRNYLCELIYLSLNNETTRLPATEALHNWFYWVNDSLYTENLLAITRELFSFSRKHKEGVGERLKLYLKEWGKDLTLARMAFDMVNIKLLTTGK